MALCSNSESLVVSQQLRVCDARDDDRLRRPDFLGKARTTHFHVGWGELCPKIQPHHRPSSLPRGLAHGSGKYPHNIATAAHWRVESHVRRRLSNNCAANG